MAVSIEEAYASSYCYELMLEGKDSGYCSEVTQQNQQQIQEINYEEGKGTVVDTEA